MGLRKQVGRVGFTLKDYGFGKTNAGRQCLSWCWNVETAEAENKVGQRYMQTGRS